MRVGELTIEQGQTIAKIGRSIAAEGDGVVRAVGETDYPVDTLIKRLEQIVKEASGLRSEIQAVQAGSDAQK